MRFNRTTAAAATLAIAFTVPAGATALASAANAGQPVISTQTVIKTVSPVSPKCYQRNSNEWIYMHYSSKANGGSGGYINYVRPTHRVTRSTTCHA